MSFPRAPPSLLQDASGRSSGRTTLARPVLDPESREKREKAAKVFEDWDLQAMHAINSGESIAQVKLRMMRAMVETTAQNTAGANAALNKQ